MAETMDLQRLPNGHEWPTLGTESGAEEVACARCAAKFRVSGVFLGDLNYLRRRIEAADEAARKPCPR